MAEMWFNKTTEQWLQSVGYNSGFGSIAAEYPLHVSSFVKRKIRTPELVGHLWL